MAVFHYVLFHRDSIDTGIPYAKHLMVLDKANIVAIGERLGAKMRKSHTKEILAKELSEYVRSHPQEVLAEVSDEQIVLIKELIDAGPNKIVWKRHLRRYDFLKLTVFVVVNYDRQGRKDGFAMPDELRETFAPAVKERLSTALLRIEEKGKKERKKRVGLTDVKRLMDGMDIPLAEKVHFLFVNNYIDYSHYEFRDEWAEESFLCAYNDFFTCKDESLLKVVNGYVMDFLREWQEDAPTLYRQAKEDLYLWMSDEWYGFKSPMQTEIEKTWKDVEETDCLTMALALSPFALKVLELLKEKKYEEAAGCCYTLFDCLAQTEKEHPTWLDAFLYEGEYTKVSMFAEAVTELYCHLRQLPDLPKDLADEMDVQIEVFNKETSFFGDLMFFSKWVDVVCDGKAQQFSHKVLEDSPMWDIWMLQQYPKLKRENSRLLES